MQCQTEPHRRARIRKIDPLQFRHRRLERITRACVQSRIGAAALVARGLLVFPSTILQNSWRRICQTETTRAHPAADRDACNKVVGASAPKKTTDMVARMTKSDASASHAITSPAATAKA